MVKDRKLNKPIDEDQLNKVYGNINILFQDIKDEHDGFVVAQELLNHMDSIRSKYSNLKVMRNRK
jgi:hypothetical protein